MSTNDEHPSSDEPQGFDLGSAQRPRMRKLSDQPNPVDIILQGRAVEPPIIVEGVEFPGVGSGFWPQLRLDISAELGKGEQVTYWNPTTTPHQQIGASAYATSHLFVEMPDSTIYVVSYSRVPIHPKIQQNHPPQMDGSGNVLIHPLAAAALQELAGPQEVRRFEGVFVIKKNDAHHLAFRYCPIIRESRHELDFRRMRQWARQYIPIE